MIEYGKLIIKQLGSFTYDKCNWHTDRRL